MSGEPATYDFTRPTGLASELVEPWTAWMNAWMPLYKERWSAGSSTAVEIQAAANVALSFATARGRLPSSAAAIYVHLGEPPLVSLLAMELRTALAWVLVAMGETDEPPAERPLTETEQAVWRYLAEQLTRSLGDAWPQKEPLPCGLGEIEPQAHRCRMLGPDELTLLVPLQLRIGPQGRPLWWVLPYAPLEQLLEPTHAARSSGPTRRLMERRAGDLPLPLSVQLGETALAVSELTTLRPGDVLVLRQKIHEPLPVRVSGIVKYYGWLGRQGSRRAIKICDVL